MASITVPTERSAHYGLRPPPAGSPTMGAASTARPSDSVFVHARQAQLAQQAAIAQQQQQVLRLHAESECMGVACAAHGCMDSTCLDE